MHEKNTEAMLAAWNEGDLDGLDDFVDADAVRRAPASMNSNADGRDQLKDVIKRFREAFPDGQVTLDEAFYQGDRSFGRWTFEGTNTGPGDFPPTGKRVKVTGTSLSRYRDGLLTEELVHFDALDMLSQLGLIDLPEG